MAASVYDIGDVVRCTGTFKDEDGNAADPTAVTFKLQDPDGNETTYVYGTDVEVIKSGTGIYYVDVTVDGDGYWYYRFVGTGTAAAAGESWFTARASEF